MHFSSCVFARVHTHSLFGRVKSLRKIITALTTSLYPVLNVFLILFLLLSIGEPPPSSFSAATAAGPPSVDGGCVPRGARVVRRPYGVGTRAPSCVRACEVLVGRGPAFPHRGGDRCQLRRCSARCLAVRRVWPTVQAPPCAE